MGFWTRVRPPSGPLKSKYTNSGTIFVYMHTLGFMVNIFDYETDFYLRRLKPLMHVRTVSKHTNCNNHVVDKRGFHAMKRTQIKDIVRNIKSNIVSWLAVVIVVTITFGVYCGVFFYADALEKKAEDFFTQTNFEDMAVTAASGMTEDECRELISVPGVSDAEGTYRLSGITLHADNIYHEAELLAVTKRISVPVLVEGNMPDSEMECAMTADAMEHLGISVGDSVSLELTGGITVTMTVTGCVQHPETYYQGEKVYIFTPASTFEKLLGAELFPVVLVDISDEGDLLSDEYFSELSSISTDVMDKMKQIHDSRGDESSTGDTGYVVTTRTDRESFMVLRLVVDVLRKLSTIFVVIFMIIGAIVVFSTITVIIDGQKRLIGFMKASGFKNSEIVRRYLIYGESAAFMGMIIAVGLAFVLQFVIQRVLAGMFCLDTTPFAFRIGTYAVLLVIELLLTGVIAAVVTVMNASKYSATKLLNWNAGEAHSHKRRRKSSGGKGRRGALFTRLIYRNICTDRARVTASIIIIAGCAFMMGIGFTLNSAFHSMTTRTREEVADYDLECSITGQVDIGELEDFVKSSGASFAKIYKKQSVYGFDKNEECITVVAAGSDIYQDYIHLIDSEGKEISVPEKGCVLIQNRISERLDVSKNDEIKLFDEKLMAYPLQVSGIARNYIGRVIFLSEETFLDVFGAEEAPDTLLIRLNGRDRDDFADMLTDRFPGVIIYFPDSMPGLYSCLTDAFDALIYVLIILSVVMSFFVLMNLVNIFVSRRKMELIIMDINGFSYRERIGYLLRETVATTVLGLIFGVLFGIVMTDPLVRIIESPDTMCVRSVNWPAWAIGVVAETIFALAINLYAFRSVKNFSKDDL